MRHRGLSFFAPPGWSLSGELVTGDATAPGGLVLQISEERRVPRGELAAAFLRRKLATLREGKEAFVVVEGAPLFVGGARAYQLRVRFRLPGVAPATLENLIVMVDGRAAETMTVLALMAPAASFGEHEPLLARVLASMRFDELMPSAPRLRPHRASFELPVDWEELVTWELRHPNVPAALVVRTERRDPAAPFSALVEARSAAYASGRTLLESAPLLRVADRGAHRIATRLSGPSPLDEVAVLVDGGPRPGTLLSLAAAGTPSSIEAAERALEELLGTVKLHADPPAAGAPRRKPLAVGDSLRGIALAGRRHDELHVELMRRGFVPARLPIAGPTGRSGERRFARLDGRTTTALHDPALASEWVYVHADGGVVRVFPHGHGSVGLGGAIGPSARMSIVPPGSSDLSLDSELGAFGPAGLWPQTLSPRHGLELPPDPEEEAGAAETYMRRTWARLEPSPPVLLPTEDRVGLGLTRSIVFARDFMDVLPRVERLAPAMRAQRREADGRLHFFFTPGRVIGFVASVTVDLGAHGLSIDPLGVPGSVESLQRFLRALLRNERYRAFDDATGEDVTATTERLPSFLVGPTRRRPTLFTSAG